MDRELPKDEQRALMRLNAKVSRCEDQLQSARNDVLDYIHSLMLVGYSQAAIARGLGVTRATLNQKVLAAGLGRGSKASKV